MRPAGEVRGADRGRERDEPGWPAPPQTFEQVQRRYWADRLERAGQRPDSLGVLRERAGQLPPGHPSSPWDGRGLPRPPVPRPAEFERADFELAEDA